MLNINNKISQLPIWHHILQSLSGSNVRWRNQNNVNNNVNNNKTVFTADDRVLIKLLRQKKGYGAKKCIAEFPSKPWTLSGLNKLLQKIDTSRFGVTSQKSL